MSRKGFLTLLAILLLLHTLESQTFSTGRELIPFLSSWEDLTEKEKKLVRSLEAYLAGKIKSPSFFTEETLEELQRLRKRRDSAFFLEKFKLEEEQNKTQIQFWVWQGKTLYQGYFSFNFIKGNWILNDLEITPST